MTVAPEILDARGRPMVTSDPLPAFGGTQSYYPSSGRGVGNGQQLYDLTQNTDFTSFRPTLDADIASMMPRFRFRAMLSDARNIYAKCGLLAGGVRSKASYVVGNAWRPQYLGTDKVWGDAAEKLLASWHRQCNLRGPAWAWNKMHWLGSKAIDVDGDYFIHRTKTADGSPRIQVLEAHRIGTREGIDEVVGGEWDGHIVNNGVVIAEDGSPVAYCVLGSCVGEDRYVPAAAMTHVFDPDWFSQTRGIPTLCNPILDWYGIADIRRSETIGVHAASMIALVEKNPKGGVNTGEAWMKTGIGGAVPSGYKTETLANGMIKYFAANSGSGLESFGSNRPSPAWQGFMAHLVASGFIGIDWAVEMVNPGELRPASARIIAGKCQRSVEARQMVIERAALACDLPALACFAERGDLPALPEDWMAWGYTKPPRVSGEVNRDAESDRQDYILGRKNMGDLIESDSGNFEEHMTERAKEASIIRRLLAENPSLTRSDFGIITPNGNENNAATTTTKKDAAAATED